MKVTPAASVLGCLVLFVGSRDAAQQASDNSPGKASRNITAKTGQAAATAGCQPSVATLKKIANDEWAASHDGDRVLAAVDEAIGPDAGDPWMFVSTGDNGLLFTVAFPARQYRYTPRRHLSVGVRGAVNSAGKLHSRPLHIDEFTIDADYS